MSAFQKFDSAVKQEIKSTERYYREQIFSSGCSSLVPIYRINAFKLTVDLLLRQLEGSPYIQKDIQFSERIIENLLDVDIYQYKSFHFFFIGDMPKEVELFVAKECTEVSSIAGLVASELWSQQPAWCNFEKNIPKLVSKYPVLSELNLVDLSKQVFSLISDLEMPPAVRGHMEMYSSQPDWRERFLSNQCSLYFMMELANRLSLSESEQTQLAMLGLVKDIGYVRLSAQVDNFEVMHPLVSFQLLQESLKNSTKDNIFNQAFISCILVHHEFVDGSGPLSRMKHPLVTAQLQSGLPKNAQISGISDLYFGFLNDYSPTLAFAIACGFVLGQGNLLSRYDPSIITAFSSIVTSAQFSHMDVPEEEASSLLNNILALLKEKNVRLKTEKMISLKCATWYEKITLALNVVRNIAFYQPGHLSEDSLVGVLNLPIEFGLNY